MGAPKDFATKLQAGTGAAHLKSFIKIFKKF
jgi:aldehyde dehydrogenase (NAD+)